MSDDDEDPFENFEDVADREGDPFEALDGDGENGNLGGDGDAIPGHDEGDGDATPAISEDRPVGTGPDEPFEATSGARDGADQEWFEGSSPAAGEPSSEPEERSDPFAESGERGDPFSEAGDRGDPFEGGESAFARMDVEGADPDAVWEQISETEDRGSVADLEEETYAEVSKHSFCERCRHFSRPPEISCSHEGTDILKFLDMDTVRVLDCPIVAERRNIEERE